MNYISVFSGVEAASVAWKDFGWHAIAFSEIDPFASAVLQYHYPTVPNLGDITKIDWSYYANSIDIIVGGSPCQSFSKIGLREGLAGESGLMFEYIRCVRDVRPTYFIWENVIGAFSSEEGAAFGQLLTAMDELGYNLCWRVLDSKYFGVAQNRRRIWLVGSYGRDTRPAEILFDTVDVPAYCGKSIGKSLAYTQHPNARLTYGVSNGAVSHAPRSTFSGKIVFSEESYPTLTCREMYVAQVDPDSRGWIGTLTPVEMERLQGFPDNYTRIPYRGKPASKCPMHPRFKAMGNSFCVPVAKWIGQRLKEYDEKYKSLQNVVDKK